MGLDGVELIMAVEEEFKIAISDAEAGRSDTVGKLVEVVHSRLRHDAKEPCPSQHGFYVIRKQLMRQLRLSRAAVTPDTKLGELIPALNRRAVWLDLIRSLTGEHATGPALVRPKRLNRLILLLLPSLAFLLALLWVPFDFFWIGFFPAIGIALLGDRLTIPFKTEFPLEFSQVKDLICLVETLDSRTWSKDEVFAKIREISVEILGVKPEQVTLGANWVKDLGVG